MIVLMAGLPGSGKSTLARALSERVSGSVLDKDEIRHALFSPRDIAFTSEQDDFVMELMLQTAGWIQLLHAERHVFLDGRTFSRRYQIDRVFDFASQAGQPCRILECVCADDAAKERLEAQASSGAHPAGNRSFVLYLAIQARFEPILRPKTVIDTDQPLEGCIHQALTVID